MRIKRFTRLAGIFDMFKKKEESLPALDRWVQKTERPQPKETTRRVPVEVASKEERINYVVKQLDAKLVDMPVADQRQFVIDFLGRYKMGTGTPEYNLIISKLKNYKPKHYNINDIGGEEVWRD